MFASRTRFSLASLIIGLMTAISIPLHAQFSWNHIGNDLTGATTSSIVIGSNDLPILATMHGIYQCEYDLELSYLRWTRVDSLTRDAQLKYSPGGRLFAKSLRGIHVSDNDGLDWRPVVDSGLQNQWTVLGESTVIWTDRMDNRIKITDDLGKTVRSFPFSKFSYYELDPGPDGTLFCHKRDSVWVSFDTGMSWEPLEFAGGELPVVDLSGGFYCVPLTDALFLLDASGILRSTDYGETWTRVDTAVVYDIIEGSDGRLYARGQAEPTPTPSNPRLYYSDDRGKSWHQHGTVPDYLMFAANSNGLLWSADHNSITVSEDGGETWHGENSGLWNIAVDTLAFVPDKGIMYAALERDRTGLVSSRVPNPVFSLHSSTDYGETWKSVAQSIKRFVGVDASGTLITLMDSVSLDTVLASYGTIPIYTHYTVPKYSTDQGKTWLDLPYDSVGVQNFLGFRLNSTAGRVTILSHWWQTGPTESQISYYWTLDGGATWSRVTDHPEIGEQPDGLFALRDGTVLITDHTGVGLSAQYRVRKFSPSTGLFSDLATVPAEEMFYGQDGLLYGYARLVLTNRLYYSSDEGSTWNGLDVSPTQQLPLNGVKVSPDGTVFIIMPGGSSYRGFRSTDRGFTWSETEVDLKHEEGYIYEGFLPWVILSDRRIVDVLHIDIHHTFSNELNFYHYYGLGWSDDGGKSWTLDTADLNLKHITAMLVLPDERMVLGTKRNGLYISDGPLSGVADDDPGLISERGHLRIAPSPISASATATAFVTLSEPGHARLELFDLLGRSCGLLADREFGSGESTVQLTMKNLAPGSYLLRMQSGEMSESMMIHVR